MPWAPYDRIDLLRVLPIGVHQVAPRPLQVNTLDDGVAVEQGVRVQDPHLPQGHQGTEVAEGDVPDERDRLLLTSSQTTSL